MYSTVLSSNITKKGRHKTQNTLFTSEKQTSNMSSRRVNFGKATVRFVKEVPEQMKKQVWYSGSELQDAYFMEIEATKRCSQTLSRSKSSLAQYNLSWRGIESTQKGYSNTDKATLYARIIVNEYKNQMRQFGNCDPEELRLIAKVYSKDDRSKARKMAVKDEEQAKKAVQQQKQIAPGEKATPPTKKSPYGNFSWFHRDLAAVRDKLPRLPRKPLAMAA